MFKEFLLLAADVTDEAVRRVLLGVGAKTEDGILLESSGDLGVDGKRKDRMFLKRGCGLGLVALGGFDRVRVRLARTVTRLASCNVLRARNTQACVDGLLKLGELRLVAGTTT